MDVNALLSTIIDVVVLVSQMAQRSNLLQTSIKIRYDHVDGGMLVRTGLLD